MGCGHQLNHDRSIQGDLRGLIGANAYIGDEAGIENGVSMESGLPRPRLHCHSNILANSFTSEMDATCSST